MLHLPSSTSGFAKYSTGNKSEITLGYEYEIHCKYYGPPPGRHWRVHDDHAYGQDTYVKIGANPPGFRGIDKHPIKDLPKHFHVSYEGLGDGRGYEIKSPVAPLKIHKLLIRKLFRDVRFNRYKNSLRNNGGIHISISNTSKLSGHHYKVFRFLHDCKHNNLFFQLSERHPDSYELYCPQNEDSWDWCSHYNIINRENIDRYEFRLFAAQKHLLLPALEMADSLFSLAQEVEDITLDRWQNFISKKLKYIHIATHLKEKLK